MAEMTAEEHAIHVLKLSIQYNNDADPDDCRLALQVIERQAAEIDTQHEVLVYQQAENDRLRDEAEKEIAKKDRMLGKACGVLAREKDCDNCPVMPCNASSCAKSWRAWLEKEAEVQADGVES